MATDRHYVGEVGTTVRVDCGEDNDISGASVHDLYVEKPDGTTEVWTGVVYSARYIDHVTVAGDFSVAGVYKLHSKLTLSGWVGYGNKTSFQIDDPLSG